MRLTAEQWFEITMAVQHGLSKASWEGFGPRPWSTLTDAERSGILSTVREKESARARALAPASGILDLNQKYLDRMTLAATKAEDAQEQHQRDVFYAHPAANRAKGVSAWKSMVGEMLVAADMFSLQQRRAIEHRLAAHGLPDLDTLLRKLDGRVKTLLKRGVIKNDDEYYLVEEVLADLEYDISEAQRARLGRMIAAYRPPKGRRRTTE